LPFLLWKEKEKKLYCSAQPRHKSAVVGEVDGWIHPAQGPPLFRHDWTVPAPMPAKVWRLLHVARRSLKRQRAGRAQKRLILGQDERLVLGRADDTRAQGPGLDSHYRLTRPL
jgi:hypothetical protein